MNHQQTPTAEEPFIPARDAAEFNLRAAAVQAATANLMQVLMAGMPAEKHCRMDALLQQGGRLGIECTVDAKADSLICLVGTDREGAHLTLATVRVPAAATPARSH